VNALATVDWALVNGRVLRVFGPVLMVAGIAGFLIHVLHLVPGLALAAVGWLGLR